MRPAPIPEVRVPPLHTIIPAAHILWHVRDVVGQAGLRAFWAVYQPQIAR